MSSYLATSVCILRGPFFDYGIISGLQAEIAFLTKAKKHMDGSKPKLGNLLALQKKAAEEITSCNQLTKALRSAKPLLVHCLVNSAMGCHFQLVTHRRGFSEREREREKKKNFCHFQLVTHNNTQNRYAREREGTRDADIESKQVATNLHSLSLLSMGFPEMTMPIFLLCAHPLTVSSL